MNPFIYMRKSFKKIRWIWKKAKKLKFEYFYRKKYIEWRETLPIEEKTILFEVQDGANPTGNVAALLDEVHKNPLYNDLTIYLSGKKKYLEDRKKYLATKGLDRVTALSTSSKEYYKVLATTKFIVSEVSFIHVFIKRPEQIYLNTWHGTPLKTLGRRVNNDAATCGNIQKTYLDANYLLCPNEFTMNVFLKDYMLENWAKNTKLLLTGYPRNSVFFDESVRERVRNEMGFGDKQIITFMPTYRGKSTRVDGTGQNDDLYMFFRELDQELTDNQLFYVKLHYMNAAGIDLSAFRHIKPFPTQYDGYEFLMAGDVFVTDYSSAFFDYANTKKKIILFTYDEEEYLADRGMYFELNDLPFPKVKDIPSLVKEISSPKEYDDTEFLNTFCKYDNLKVPEAVCKKLILGEDSPLIEQRDVPDNGKENVLIYAGSFLKNGITSAFYSLINSLDLDKYNYAVFFRIGNVKKHQESITCLPEKVFHFGHYFSGSITMKEWAPYLIWKHLKIGRFSKVEKTLENLGRRERARLTDGLRVDHVVQYFGYSEEITSMFEGFDCNRIILAHNDMKEEARTKKNVDLHVLGKAFTNYNKVACVTDGIIPVSESIAESWCKGGKHAEFRVAKNIIPHEKIAAMATEDIFFDETTTANAEFSDVVAAINSNKTKFINIGRFSPEKGHMRLISAFEKIHRTNPDTMLVIIGGYGPMYDDTVARVERSECRDSIFLIKAMSNPYTILSRCDCFVLSSFYEGFGLVLAEADVCSVPCFTTDIPAPKSFMTKYNGVMVENSEEGIFEGMKKYLEGEIPAKLTCDYYEYNREAVAEFEALLSR